MTPGKNLSAADWATIVVLYQRGEKTVRQLAEQFGVTRQAIEKGLKERNIEKASRLDEVISETNDAARVELARRVGEANKIKTDYASYIAVLSRTTMRKVVEAEKAGQLASANADIIVLGNAIKTIAKAREETWAILDIPSLADQGDELPDLNIGEYSNQEIGDIREANEVEYQTTLDDEDEDAARA